METTLYILLTIALVSRPTICTPAPEETNSDEGREQTQIDQLYQIYKATQNNIIQLNTEVSLINDQLAELREKSASKSKVDDELSHLSSTVKSNFRQLLTDFQHLENEVVLNNSRKIDGVYSEVNAVNDRLQSSVSSLNTANGGTTTQLNSLQSSVSSLNAANGATTTQLNSLQSSVNSLNTTTMTQLNSLQSSTTTQLNSLQTSVNSLTTRVNSPVNLYQNCIQETRSCTNAQFGSVYWNYCITPALPVNKSVSC